MGFEALIPLILDFLPGAISTVQKLFPSSGHGSNKMSVVVQQVRALVEKLVATKVPLPGGGPIVAQPTDDMIQGLAEAVLAKMKATGGFDTQSPAGEVFLVTGKVQAITLGPLQK